jgi:8-oxo-dGTP pyrophosphatase MutT (NUDIX family)
MNSELYNNVYLVPKDVLAAINTAIYKYPDSEGIKRAKNIVGRGKITYQNLKRLKNFFTNKTQGSEFELAGGNLMANFVNKTLDSERTRVKNTEDRTSQIKPDLNRDLKPHNTNISTAIHENDDKEKEIETVGLSINVVAIIIDKDKRILLLKRSNFKDQWQPNKWSLPGGKVEEDEDSVAALKREVKEETGLDFEKFLEKFVVQRSSDNVEHIFTVKFEGEPEEVDVDFENNGFGWFTISEIRYLNTVPNLMDYIRMAITEY